MARVVLVGLPGVGKSTLASQLATSLGCVAIDTDDALATIVGCSAPEYWRRVGEVAFRAAERVALRTALEVDAVVATGGEVVSSAEARELLRHERTLWLDCDDDVLMERLVEGDRPLVADDARTTLERLRSEREPWYRDVAFARIDASGTPSDVNVLIREALAGGAEMNITVELGQRSYDVVLSNGARHQLGKLVQSRVARAKVAVIVTSRSLREQPWFDLDTGIDQHVVEVPEGEAAKTFDSLSTLCEQLAHLELSRHDVVVGVGGGAITDLAGFAAAIYLRGIALVQIPSSLVGQVDAAIGGKTAVNMASGKNLVGAFHQPIGVLCDFETLSTLPERERRAGLGEVAKCWLLEGRSAGDLAGTSQSDLVAMSVKLKAAIVSSDEFESDRRALLNYGHTLGHALELLALERGADELRHGEAVAIGLAFAARLARALGRVDRETVVNHDRVLDELGLSNRVPAYLETSDLLGVMSHDKKAHHDLTFVLAGPGGFDVVNRVDPQLVREVLDRFRGET